MAPDFNPEGFPVSSFDSGPIAPASRSPGSKRIALHDAISHTDRMASERGGSLPARAPNCLKCEFFAVSWDPDFPRSCRVFGVKSRELPSVVVYQSTGRHCPAFRESERLKRARSSPAAGPELTPGGV